MKLSFKNSAQCLLFWCLYAAGTNLAIASTQTGKVVSLHIRASDGLIYFELDGPRGSKPACAANHNYFIIKAETTSTGRQQYALLLAAKVSSTSVTVIGSNSCTRWVDGEDADEIAVG